jgi:phospholipid/cholesterol/gamma-HCH transport system substrate-binding protein
MQKQAPSASRLAVMLVFALSCFALLLYLWTTFGGPVPLAPKGYRVEVRFEEATQLADNADVRISGVNVGRVVRSEHDGERTRATIEIEDEFAPIPRDTKAILRLKTLLGETYVEITPGDRRAGLLADGATLPDTQVLPTTELDEVLRAFDPRTRRDFRRLLSGLASALEDRSMDLSAAIGNAAPFAEDTGSLLEVLDTQRGAVRRLVRDTGTVFEALGRRQGELSSLVASVDTVLQTTASRNRELEETIRILPTTLRELRPTLEEIEGLAGDAAPVVSALRPAGRALAPALQDAAELAPELRRLFLDVDQVTSVSRRALPAATRTVDAALPLFRELTPTLQEAHPIVDYLGLYKSEVAATFAGVAAATQGTERTGPGRPPVHYLRALVPFTAEGFLVNDRRAGSNRHNPYGAPRWLDNLATGLESIDCSNTGNGGIPQPAPPCKVQEPIEFRGERNAYPHVTRDP